MVSPLSLCIAAKKGNIEKVTALIASGVDLSIQRKDGWTALHVAANAGHAEIVQLLIAAGIDVSIKNKAGKDALYYAVQKVHLEIVRLLIVPGSDVFKINKVGSTHLHVMAKAGALDIVQSLLALGVDRSIINSNGYTALLYALRGRHHEIVRLLLIPEHIENIEKLDGAGCTSLMAAARYGYLELVQMLLAYGASVDTVGEGGMTALHHAAARGDVAIIHILLDNGAAVDCGNRTPLLYAARNGRVEAVRALLSRGAAADVNDSYALYQAVSRSRAKLIPKMLLEHGADPLIVYKGGATALHVALMNRDSGLAQLLLDYGAGVHVNAAVDGGVTPLMLATLHDNVGECLAVIDRLRALGADVNICDNKGMTALHYAGKNDDQIIKLSLELYESIGQGPIEPAERAPSLIAAVIDRLLTLGADLNACDNKGMTALHYAVVRGDEEVFKLLLERGACIETRDRAGRTPLHLAVIQEASDLTRMLLQANADVNIMNNRRESPLILAALHDRVANIALLLDAGADVSPRDQTGKKAIDYARQRRNAEVIHMLRTLKSASAGTEKLHAAIKNLNEPGHIAAFIKGGVGVDGPESYGNSPLMTAISCNQTDVVRSLLLSHANVQAEVGSRVYEGCLRLHYSEKNDRYSLLHYAVREGNVEIVQLLLEFGADVDAKSLEGATALHFAACKGNEKIITLLIENAAHVNEADALECTPLMIACQDNNLVAADILLAAGAKANEGNVLHNAVREGKVEMIKLLLKYGADARVVNSRGKRALYYARELGNKEIIKLLTAKSNVLCQSDGEEIKG